MAILIVDDEPAICSLVTRILRRHGFDAVAAVGPEEALRVAQDQHRFRMIISDVRMPGMDGPELTEKLKSRWPWLKVLFISGHADAAPRPLLPKPFTAVQLVDTVRAIIAGT
jgi:CheY-like chemotaxis protein